MFSSCSRFRKIKNRVEDGVASVRQQRFYEMHLANCQECGTFDTEMSDSLAALSASAMEPEVSDTFDSIVLRRALVQQKHQRVTYWLPMVAGAVAASVAILAVLQILLTKNPVTPSDIRGQEAQLRLSQDEPFPVYNETVSNEIAP